MSAEILSGDIIITEDTGFKAPIVDAYSFRCLMDFIGATVVNLPIIVEPKRIHASRSDINKTIFHTLEIDTDKIPDFYIHPDLEEIELCVSMRQFRAKIKNAQKRTVTLTLFNTLKNKYNFYAIIVVPNKKNNGTIIVDTIKKEAIHEYEISDYIDNLGNKIPPNLVLHVTDISGVFGHIANSKCTYAEFICYSKGILIKGFLDNKLTCIQPLGRCVNPLNVGEDVAALQNGTEVCRYNIPTVNIKPFCKIGNISPQSATLQIHYAKNKDLKIVFPIGTSGVHQVFLTNVDPKTMKPV